MSIFSSLSIRSLIRPLCVLLAGSFFLLSSGCKRTKNLFHHGNTVERIRAKQTKPVNPKFFKQKLKVIKEHLIDVHWKTPERHFATLRRVSHIKRYPCSSCHNAKMKKKGQTGSAFRFTHGDIKLKHAPKGTLKCSSCHNPTEMNKLRAPNGQSFSFDRTYKLCGSCHRKVAKDWAGGAHGKRLKRWFGRRVVWNCTQCHNPHNPLAHFGKRWPKAHFTLPVRNGGRK